MTRTSKRIARLGWLAPAGALCLALAAPAAHADAMLSISDGTNSITLSDGGSGAIVYDSLVGPPPWSALGGWLFNVDFATTQPLAGSSGAPDMHLSVSAFGSGTLDVTFTDPGFIGDGPIQLFTEFGGDLGTGGSATVSSSIGAQTLASFGPSGSGWIAGSEASNGLTLHGPYSLTLSASITNTQPRASSLDASVAVPEPGTLALLAAALLGGILLMRRPRRMVSQRSPNRRADARRG